MKNHYNRCKHNDKASWKECNDYLKCQISRSKFVKKIRHELREKRKDQIINN